jgi:hypothetical protein
MRDFEVYQITPGVIEARFDDEASPISVQVTRISRWEIKEALTDKLHGVVTLHCPNLDP